jgi:hypothetical protein
MDSVQLVVMLVQVQMLIAAVREVWFGSTWVNFDVPQVLDIGLKEEEMLMKTAGWEAALLQAASLPPPTSTRLTAGKS